jgi:anaphase-promoting complex subunit 3
LLLDKTPITFIMGAPAAPTPQYHHATPLDNRGRPVKANNPSAATAQPAENLEATYTSLIQEYLQVMCIENATFLAERMVATFRSSNAWYLLGVCHYRSNAPQRALSVLENNSSSLRDHPSTAYLMAKCCFQLQQFGRAEEILLEMAREDYREYKATYIQNHPSNAIRADDKEGPMSMDEWLVETSPCPVPNGAAGLYLLGNVCRRSNRKRRAMEYYRMSLQVR